MNDNVHDIQFQMAILMGLKAKKGRNLCFSFISLLESLKITEIFDENGRCSQAFAKLINVKVQNMEVFETFLKTIKNLKNCSEMDISE